MRSQWLGSLVILVVGVAVVSEAYSQNRSGTYYRSDQYGRGDITFREVGSGTTRRLSFEVSIAGAQRGTCIGWHRGKAKWLGQNIAEYNGDFNEVDSEGDAIGCRLTFVFTGSRVTIRETNCDDQHGVSCQFEGVYSLRKKRKNRDL